MIFLKIIIIICFRFICLYILQTYFNCITISTLWSEINLSYHLSSVVNCLICFNTMCEGVFSTNVDSVDTLSEPSSKVFLAILSVPMN